MELPNTEIGPFNVRDEPRVIALVFVVFPIRRPLAAEARVRLAVETVPLKLAPKDSRTTNGDPMSTVPEPTLRLFARTVISSEELMVRFLNSDDDPDRPSRRTAPWVEIKDATPVL
jgi:hypothetical protein